MKIKIQNISAYLFLFVVGITSLKAQQRPLYSQYMLNQYLINPAFTGATDSYEATTNFRYQWVGLVDAPRTYALTVQGPSKTGNYGLGGSLFNDVTGPTSKTGINLSYAYHLKLSGNQRLAMGLSGGIMQFKVDGTKITVFDAGDQVLSNQRMSTLVPDFGFGIYWYQKKKFYIGVSAPQTIESPISFVDNNVKTLSKLTRHFFANAAYTFNLGDNFAIEPSVLVKYSAPVDLQFDAGARIFFRDVIWIGAVYRTDDAISGIIGYNTPDDKITIGYSYDFTTTNVQNYSFGTHEIMLKARFGAKKGYTGKGKEKKSEFEQLQSKFEEIELEELRREEAEKKKEEDKVAAKKELKELAIRDKELRTKIRKLRSDAEFLGFESPKDPNFSMHKSYVDALKELKELFARKKELEAKLNE